MRASATEKTQERPKSLSAEPSRLEPAERHLRFRPDIEGLRAVAVAPRRALSRRLAAASRGGFLGVDVFFVISGFLITGLLCDELAPRGASRSRASRARRARRLLPAAALVAARRARRERVLALADSSCAPSPATASRLRSTSRTFCSRRAARVLRRRRAARSAAAHLVARPSRSSSTSFFAPLRCCSSWTRAARPRGGRPQASSGRVGCPGVDRVVHRLPRARAALSRRRVLRAAGARLGVRPRRARDRSRRAREPHSGRGSSRSSHWRGLAAILVGRRDSPSRVLPLRASSRLFPRWARRRCCSPARERGRRSSRACSPSADRASSAGCPIPGISGTGRCWSTCASAGRSPRFCSRSSVALLSLIPAAIAYWLVESPIRFSVSLKPLARQTVAAAVAARAGARRDVVAAIRRARRELATPRYASHRRGARAVGHLDRRLPRRPAGVAVAIVRRTALHAPTPRSCCSATRMPHSGSRPSTPSPVGAAGG